MASTCLNLTQLICIGELEGKESEVVRTITERDTLVRAAINSVVTLSDLTIEDGNLIITTKEEVLPERAEGMGRAVRDLMLEALRVA